MRINQFIAHAGICARRAADKLITTNQILVNGTPLKDLSYQVQPNDTVTYQGKILKINKKYHVLLHKPPKYLTTLYDPQGRPTVMDLVKLPDSPRIYPVGRLDYLTTGLLILTNDGILSHQLAHPSQKIIKKYTVTLNTPLSPLHFKQIQQGILLEDGFVPIDHLALLGRTKLSISIHIGRNRIIRRLFSHLGYDVTQLTRTQYAHLTLKGIPQGKWRFLSQKEIKLFTHPS